MADIDSLKIKVEVDAGNASDNLKDIREEIEKLQEEAAKKSIGDLSKSLKGLSNAALGLKKLPGAVQAISAIKVPDSLKVNLNKIAVACEKLSALGPGVKRFGDGLEKLKQVGADEGLSEKFNSIANAMDSLFAHSDAFQKISESGAGFKKFSDGLSSIQAVSSSGNISSQFETLTASLSKFTGITENLKGLSDIGNGFKKFGEGLDKVRAVSAESGFDKKMESVTQAFKKFAENSDVFKHLGELGNGIKNFGDGLAKLQKLGLDEKLEAKLMAVANALIKFANSIDTALSESRVSRLERFASAFAMLKGLKAPRDLGDAADQAGKAVTSSIKWGSIEKAFNTLTKGANDLGQAFWSVIEGSGIVHDFSKLSGAMSSNIPVLNELVDAWSFEAKEVKQILLSQTNFVDKAAQLMIVRVSHLTRVLYNFVKIPFSSVSMKATKSIVGLLTLPFRNFGQKVTDLTKRWDRFSASIGRIAIYRIIRTALKVLVDGFKEGTENLYQWGLAWRTSLSSADRFVNSMDRLATAVLFLKNSVSAAVSPLIDYFAPAIDFLIDKFVALVNVINQAVAVLTGASIWRKALKYPVSYAEAADTASGKVKELQRTVLAFDELNKLNDTSGSGGSAADALLDYSKMFKEMPVSDRIKSLLDAEDWNPVGEIIAGKINSALGSIDWTSIESKVKATAKRLGTVINGFITRISMPLVGISIGKGINTFAGALNEFYDAISFTNLGRKLSEGFEHTIETIDWAELGRAVSNKIQALFNILKGFKGTSFRGLGDGVSELIDSMFENVDLGGAVSDVGSMLPKLGTEFGKIFNSLIENINKEFENIDFFKFGAKFGVALSRALEKLNPKEAGKFLTNGLAAILDFMSGAVKTLNWAKLNDSIGKMVAGMFENLDLTRAVGDVITIAENIVTMLTTVVNTIPWERVGEAIAQADFTGLVDGIKKLFSSVVDGLKKAGVLDDILGGLAAFVGLKLAGLGAKLIPSLITGLVASGGGGGIASAISGALSSVGGAISASPILATGLSTAGGVAGGAILGQQFSHHILGPILEGFGSSDAELYKNWTFFGEGGLFQASIDLAKFTLEDFGKSARAEFDLFGASTTTLKDLFTGNYTAIGTDVDNLKEKFVAWKDNWLVTHPLISGGFESLKEDVTATLDVIGQNVDNTKTTLSAVGTWISENFAVDWSTAWDSIKKSFSNVWAGMKATAKGAINGIIGFINDLLGAAELGINGLVGGLTGLSGSSILGKELSVNIPTISVPRIPALASGGLVGSGNLFVAGEAGPELVTSWGNDSAVLNVDQIVEAIAQGVSMASGGDVTIPIYLDGNVLDKTIVTAQQRQNMRSGR